MGKHCIIILGTQHQVRVVFCQCESERVTLLRLNLWAATPSRPTLAFSIDLFAEDENRNARLSSSSYGLCSSFGDTLKTTGA